MRLLLPWFAFFSSLALAQASGNLRPLTTVYPPSPQQMAEICKGTDDLRECGRRIEGNQIQAIPEVVNRNGRLLSIKLTETGAVHFLDIGGAEAGESFSLFGFHAPADTVTLYHSKENKLGFIVVSRVSGAGSAVPNEPIFSSSGSEFLTVDVCKRDCEQRVTLWRIRGDAVRRHAEFVLASTVVDAQAAFTPNGSVWVETTGLDDKKLRIELPPGDRRWIFAPQS